MKGEKESKKREIQMKKRGGGKRERKREGGREREKKEES